MTDTDKYDFVLIDYTSTGWNNDLTTNMEKVDDHLHTRVLITLGETVSAGHALYLNQDGKYYKAQADGTKQPSLGLAVEGGDADDQIRMQREGSFSVSSWEKPPRVRDKFKAPYAIFLDDTTAGELSHNEPGSNSQLMGYATAGDTMFVDIELKDVGPAFPGTSSTTSTSTTTSTTTSTSSTTTTTSTTVTTTSTTTTTTSSTTTTTTTSSSTTTTTSP